MNERLAAELSRLLGAGEVAIGVVRGLRTESEEDARALAAIVNEWRAALADFDAALTGAQRDRLTRAREATMRRLRVATGGRVNGG